MSSLKRNDTSLFKRFLVAFGIMAIICQSVLLFKLQVSDQQQNRMLAANADIKSLVHEANIRAMRLAFNNIVDHDSLMSNSTSHMEHTTYSRDSSSIEGRAGDPSVLATLGKAAKALNLVRLPPPAALQNKSGTLPRICCFVNTYSENHATRAQAVKDTWGRHCSKLVFFSNISDAELPSIKLAAPATHTHLWFKHQESLLTLYQLYGSSYDWFYKADDDTYAFIENLQAYISSREIQKYDSHQPQILGHRMSLQDWAFRQMKDAASKHGEVSSRFSDVVNRYSKNFPNSMYHYTPGGGGYAFNAPYLKKVVALILENKCFNTDVIPDDFALNLCMTLEAGVKPGSTRDGWQRERFHQYSPARVYHEKTTGPNSFWWQSDHIGEGFFNGTDCCSSETVAFHYIKPEEMYTIEKAFYQEH